ncbi:unnamed protein product [Cladocopium goreaui]|uniref:Uncharacterized protein n=1 Tax=Cladocopium goreaui TaxID=2562237 RepID=A0A9P1CEQ2_9DINO|nr:unnamed protein product [Cladocopium goreaui]
MVVNTVLASGIALVLATLVQVLLAWAWLEPFGLSHGGEHCACLWHWQSLPPLGLPFTKPSHPPLLCWCCFVAAVVGRGHCKAFALFAPTQWECDCIFIGLYLEYGKGDTDGDGCLSSEQQRENQRGMAAMASAFASPVSVASAGRSATGATRATRATLASRGAGGVAVADETGWHPKLAATAALAVTFSLGKRGKRAAVRPKVFCRATNIFERSSLEAGAKLLEEAVKSSNGSNPTEFTSFSEEKNRQSYVSQQAALEGLEDVNGVDDDGLPLVYSVERIANFWVLWA